MTTHPRLALGIALLAIAIASTGLTKLIKDTSVKAFISSNHPALIADEKAADIFGLSDTIAIVPTTTGATVFEANALEAISTLTETVSALPNMRSDRVMSLATESSISGSGGEIFVTPYIGKHPLTAQDIDAVRTQWQMMPPHIGTLVSQDESSAIVLAEIIDSHIADKTYQAVLDIVSGIETDALEIHVAGPAAVSGYLSRYIDKDVWSLQYLHDDIRGAPLSLVSPDRERLVTAFLRRSFNYDSVALIAKWYRSLDLSDEMFSVELEFAFGDSTHLKFAANGFSGVSTGIFGQFADRDRLTLGLTHRF